ncbi:xanthine dehydrogenase accessory factor [Sulfitobacter undariae]|uniref:Xanthine dehydrogenase accessory factor n=1 Tax=Sulfitobacter undariae TaxID=1563671 RepID=A0A7W6EC56_9RHOB|nr:xanthine dehydrogenase accessory protein XdhC [Sulfitobacter undariae]MBB3995488.1 xanthine dehydrogenase accessory factor [Sulfitobacter undariae]
MNDAIYIEITHTRGSAPRDAGTAMKVTADGIEGTIGGGALEYLAIDRARHLLATEGNEESRTIPLGPSLGQCCGGAVTLRYTRVPKATDTAQTTTHPIGQIGERPENLWIWGAGHVGRAVVAACPSQAFNITWIDSSADRFPQVSDKHITKIPTSDMPLLATRAPANAHHLIFTYSHDIDLALCAALVQRGAASIGLIGSDTKWARFSKRLRASGLDPNRIICPIGDKTLGKAPHQIAHGTVQALLAVSNKKVPA